MKKYLNIQKPLFVLTTASLVLAALGTTQTANAQSASSASVSSFKAGLKVGSIAYVSTDKLNLRSQASLGADVVVGALGRNDQVQTLGLLDNSTPLVKIKIVKSAQASNSLAAELFVSGEYLSASASSATVVTSSGSRYVVIQNVATERMRIYERCTSAPGCANRLVMETEMVVGRDTKKDNFLTWLGRYKITEWVKFYQDQAEHYPSWYDPNYPALPKPGSSSKSWMSSKVMPGKKGDMRGAFGWYAATLAPNANYQWIHGTIGWGADGTKHIEMTRNTFLNIIANPRSSGCTRLENRAVAFARDLLPVGTEIIRVYAREAFRDASRARYAAQAQPRAWEFILTKEGVRQKGAATSAKNAVLARGVSQDMILEQGSYAVDQFPNAVPFKEDASWKSRVKGKSGNTYNIPDDGFRGYYLVDDGTFVNYTHPAGLDVGGFEGAAIPAALQTSGDFTVATETIR